jgi:hypothetical protein
MRSLLAALAVFAAFACGPAGTLSLEGPAAVPQPGPTTRQRLEQDSTSFRVQPVLSLGRFTTRTLVGGESAVPLQLVDGWFDAHALASGAGPVIAVMHFDATLEDVKFTKGQLPPNGLTLTGVRFALKEPQLLHVKWLGDGNVGVATGSLAVEVHSALLLSTGSQSPLAVAQLEVPVELTVGQTANGLIGLWLDVTPQGSLWNWAGLIELGDLSLAVQAYTPSLTQLPPGVELN